MPCCHPATRTGCGAAIIAPSFGEDNKRRIRAICNLRVVTCKVPNPRVRPTPIDLKTTS